MKFAYTALRQAFVLLFLASLSLAACSEDGTTGEADDAPPDPCTFTNPVAEGQDPWVVKTDDAYYLVESRDNAIYVYRSEALTDIKQNDGVQAWAAPDSGWNQTHIWAPELHFVDGRWYIYYAAGRSGPPFIHQRSGVLQSAGRDPQGEYVDKGMLYTGDDVASGSENVWSIDLTVTRLGGQLYAVWSGWEENQSDDATPQHLYVAEMSDPWTIGSDRVRISSPVEPWEEGIELDLNEAPQFLKRGDDVFIVYSAHESWLPAYRLGQLRLRRPDADPMDPESWVKSGPVFTGTDSVHGTGHASFIVSPDSTEDWLVYHSKVDTEPGWDRVIRMQPFGWQADGTPDFGTPAPPGEPMPVPSGQAPCE